MATVKPQFPDVHPVAHCAEIDAPIGPLQYLTTPHGRERLGAGN